MILDIVHYEAICDSNTDGKEYGLLTIMRKLTIYFNRIVSRTKIS
jgi:hypothetical protein